MRLKLFHPQWCIIYNNPHRYWRIYVSTLHHVYHDKNKNWVMPSYSEKSPAIVFLVHNYHNRPGAVDCPGSGNETRRITLFRSRCAGKTCAIHQGLDPDQFWQQTKRRISRTQVPLWIRLSTAPGARHRSFAISRQACFGHRYRRSSWRITKLVSITGPVHFSGYC